VFLVNSRYPHFRDTQILSAQDQLVVYKIIYDNPLFQTSEALVRDLSEASLGKRLSKSALLIPKLQS
jgi:hypothetical protein